MSGFRQEVGLGPLAAPPSERAADWRQFAACLDEDPELFFLVAGTNTYAGQAQLQEAKAVCARCPSKAPCLTWALETGQGYGVWGGLGEEERRALRRRAPKPKPAPEPTAARPVGQEGPGCGDEAGAGRHRRKGEQPCPVCSAGEYRARSAREARRRGARA